MKRKVVKALLVIFLLFTVGGVFAVFSLRQIDRDLGNLIKLHRVEIIRQDLVINVQNVQSNMLAVGTGFGKELDEIVDSVVKLNKAIHKCSGCHHKADINRGIVNVHDLIEQYKEALSAYITTTAGEQRVSRLKMVTADIGDMILERTQEMAFIANKSLHERTEHAVSKVVLIQKLIIATLLITMIIGVLVATYLTRLVTDPLDVLAVAAREVSEGNLGYTANYEDDTEFGRFARTFNEMSLSLRDSHDKIMSYTNRLSLLTRVTVTLYGAMDRDELLQEAFGSLHHIIDVERVDIILPCDEKGVFCLMTTEDDERTVCIDENAMNDIFHKSNRKAVIHNEVTEDTNILREFDDGLKVRDLMVVWLKHKNEFRGALKVANKRSGKFDTEDLRILSIFANNLIVALDNLRLYDDLLSKMDELKETQQQLIQAAKLAAIGELASNVAHEINNPLTSILGYAELIKDESDLDLIMSDIEIIQAESLRARDIVKQLLEFSRKKPLELKWTDVNALLQDVLKLASVKIKSTQIRIKESYGEIPAIMADDNQLKQVFINFINNGIAAMGVEGTLTIETGESGNSVFVNITDTGSGIDSAVLPHIFEPFFTTKEEKGTGLGLSISYRIVEAHGGRITVHSKKEEGSQFVITLPVRQPVSRVSL